MASGRRSLEPVEPVEPDTLERIAHALEGLRFGSIHIIVQDSRVVQIEKTEKLRLAQPAA